MVIIITELRKIAYQVFFNSITINVQLTKSMKLKLEIIKRKGLKKIYIYNYWLLIMGVQSYKIW